MQLPPHDRDVFFAANNVLPAHPVRAAQRTGPTGSKSLVDGRDAAWWCSNESDQLVLRIGHRGVAEPNEGLFAMDDPRLV